MEVVKTYGNLFFGLLAVFLLGLYASAVKFDIMIIEPYRWIITSFFGVFFIISFIIELKKNN